MPYLNLFLGYICFELMCHEAMMQDLSCLEGYEDPDWCDEPSDADIDISIASAVSVGKYEPTGDIPF